MCTRCRLDDSQVRTTKWQCFQCLGQRRHLPPQIGGGRGGPSGLLGSDQDDPAVGHVRDARGTVELGPAPAALLGVEASAQLHQGLADITRDGTGWATPALIAQRVHLAEVTGLLRDALGAGRARAGRFAELPSELARAGQIRAPARLLAAMDPHPGRRGPELDSAPRISDVANRRIVLVRPEQTAGATATAADLGRQMTALTQALETLPLGRANLTVVEPAPSAHTASRGVRPAHSPRANTHLGRNVTARGWEGRAGGCF